MPEGDTIHRAAARLQVLVGERIEATSPHPRARAERVAEQIDGRRLESVTAHGKNLVLRFEGGVVVRSHLRMSGRWTVRPRGQAARGTPWLVLRGARAEGVLWNGPVLELHTRALARLGPDILERPPRIDAMLARLRAADATRWFGESLLDQQTRLRDREHVARRSAVGGAALALAAARRRRRGRTSGRARDRRDDDARLGRRRACVGRQVYRRVGRPCPRCRTPIRSYGQGDDNRMTYWCPGCQRGTDPRGA